MSLERSRAVLAYDADFEGRIMAPNDVRAVAAAARLAAGFRAIRRRPPATLRGNGLIHWELLAFIRGKRQA